MKKAILKALVCAVLSLSLSTLSHSTDLMIGARTELAMDPTCAMARHQHVLLQSHLRQPDADRREVGDRSRPRGELEDRLRHRMAVQSAQGREIPRRLDRSMPPDIVPPFQRRAHLPTATSPYTGAIATVKDVKAVDDDTVVDYDDAPRSGAAARLANIQIIPSSLANATTDSFNTGKSVVGTGPYKFASFKAGDRLELARNPDYWGAKPKWDRVTFRFIPDDAARVAALLGNDVDLIDFVPPRLVERFKSAPNADAVPRPLRSADLPDHGHRARRLALHQGQGRQALTKNPLKDRRVREALTFAIDRDLLTKRVMDGAATPSSQPTAPGFGGYNDSLKVPPYDARRAPRSCSPKPGYPDGFAHDRPLHQRPLCQRREGLPGDRPDAGARRAEDVGRDAAALGVLPGGDQSHARTPATASCCSAGATPRPATPGWFRTCCIPTTERAARHLESRTLFQSRVDKAIEARPSTHGSEDSATRRLAQAMKLAMEDHALIPLYTQSVIMAARKG